MTFMPKNRSLILAVLFVAVSVAMFWWTTWQQKNLYAVGCDDFGYLRQAQLFNKFGPVRGLWTRIQAPEALFILDVVKSLGLDSKDWYQLVAPHCHHYIAATDSIVLQYPPGTGFLISLFPKSAQYPYSHMFVVAVIALGFTWAVLSSKLDFFPWLLAILVLPLIDWTMARDWFIPSSPSSPLTLMLLPLLLLLMICGFPAGQPARPGVAFWVGLVGGLLFALRLPNLFLLAGLAFVPLFNSSLAAKRELVSACLVALAGFVLTGAIPVLAANWINAGSPFATTYPEYDATVPKLDTALMWDHFKYYFWGWSTSLTTVVAVCLLVIRVITRRRIAPVDGRFGLSIGVSIAFILSIAFFITHDMPVPYYTMPASVLVLTGVVFELLNVEASLVALRFRSGAVVLLIPMVVSGAIRWAHITPVHLTNDMPLEVLQKDAIVWADISSGTPYYYLGKYAARLPYGSPCEQDRIVQRVSELGRDQFLIADSPMMAPIIDRYTKLLGMKKIGDYITYLPFSVFKIPAGTQWPVKVCTGV